MQKIIDRCYELSTGLRYTAGRRRSRLVSFISLASMIGIAIGVTTLIAVLSVVNGFERELKTRVLAMASHATISAVNGRMTDWATVSQVALRNPEVQGAAPYVSGEGMARSGDTLSAVLVQGILPREQPQVSDIASYMQAGSLDELKPGSYNVIIGNELARKLRVKPGDKLGLMTLNPSAQGSLLPRLRQFNVVGIFSFGMYEFDKGSAYIHMADAQALYGSADSVTGVRLKLHDPLRAAPVAMDVASSLAGLYYVDDWTRSHGNYFRAVASTKSVMFIIMSLILAVAAFNIVSTLVMVVQDKQADIAILRTLGATPRSVMAIFMVQGTIIGAIGTALGVLGGIGLSLSLESLVAAFQAVSGHQLISAEIYNIGDLPSDLESFDVIRIAALSLFLGLASTLYPAWRASRMPPAEALRYE